MDWCSYFRVRNSVNFAAMEAQIDAEIARVSVNIQNPLVKQSTNRQSQVTVPGYAGPQTLLSTYWHTRRPMSAPNWLNFATQISGVPLTTQNLGQSFSGILLLDLLGRRYILTFGAAHTIAKKVDVERRFGKIVVSNGKLPDEVRAISARTHGNQGKSRRETRGRGGPTRVLEVPKNANMASGIAAKMSINGVEIIADGATQIRAMAPTGIQNLADILGQLENWWNAGIETDAELASLDKVDEISDPVQIALLDTERRNSILNPAPNRFSLCLDHDEMWDATSLRYRVGGTSIPMQVPDFTSMWGVLTYLPAGTDPLQISFYADVPSRNSEYSCKLTDNLAFEFTDPATQDVFTFEDAGWYRCKNTWVQQVATDITSLVAQSTAQLGAITLSPYNRGDTEDDYITSHFLSPALAARSKQYHLWNTGYNLEFCDICMDSNVLFFIKRGSGRNSCIDVCSQALDSANALVDRDQGFLNNINADLATKGWAFDTNNRPNYTFCVVLLTGNPGRTVQNFSIRARAALSDHLREIDKLGFKSALLVL
jgi:uncharacterized protein (TIGR04141 family)